MNQPPFRIVDWRAPKHVLIVDEDRLVRIGELASLEGCLFTGSAVVFENNRLIALQSFENGCKTDSDPFDLFIRRELLEPAYRDGPHFRTRHNQPFGVHTISEGWTGPYVDGEPYTGLTLFASAKDYHVLSTFDKGKLAEHFWLDGECVVDYVGIDACPSDSARSSTYQWDDDGRIAEYTYLDGERESDCEIMIRNGHVLRVLRINGKSVLDSSLPRHDFDRFGSFTDVRQLDGCRLSDYLSLAGDGVDTDVLGFLTTLLASGRPEEVWCSLDIDAPPHIVALFLASAANSKAGLTNTCSSDHELLESVTAELSRLRPELPIEIE